MNTKQLQSGILLSATAFIWGFGIVAQRAGMDYIGPFAFTAIRFGLGSISLLPLIYLMDRLDMKDPGKESFDKTVKIQTRNNTLKAGIICGCVLFLGAAVQQVGIQYTTAGKAGFISSFYMVFVPIFSVFLKKKIHLNVWISVLLSVIGLYLLCIKQGFSIGIGDLLVLGSCIFYAAHILTIDHYIDRIHALKMSATQFATTSLLGFAAVLLFESNTLTLQAIIGGAIPILYAGIISCGVAYTFQVLGQKNANPAVAGLILSMESVFAAIGGALILHEVMSAKEILGCVLVFAAVLLAQFDFKPKAS